MPGRDLGVAVALDRLLPPAIRDLFGLLTSLGDAAVLLGAVALYYWFGDRERGAVALAATLGATALTLALKGLFALPRPPSALHAGTVGGYGFPSGHAITATVTVGVVAPALDRWSGRARATVAGAAVTVVVASRVAIGVHYVPDVAVGVAVGLACLATLVRVVDWRPGPAFGLAVAAGVAAVAANGPTPDAVAALAGAFGAAATWAKFESTPTAAVEPPVAVACLAALGSLGYAGNALGLGRPAVAGLNAAVAAGILVVPLAVERTKRGASTA
jgi:membrane-associated phospholipid phosphatase